MKRALLLVSLVALAGGSSALAAPGDPPAGLSPIAGSVFTAQFALCSLSTIAELAHSQGVAVGALSPAAAALRVAQTHERDLGSAAVRGCRGGLLYRYRNDQAVAGLRSDLSQRVTAEKYVAGVYGLIVIAFFAYVVIHAAKVSRLRRDVSDLVRVLDPSSPTSGV